MQHVTKGYIVTCERVLELWLSHGELHHMLRTGPAHDDPSVSAIGIDPRSTRLWFQPRWKLGSSITSIASPRWTSSCADSTAVYTVSQSVSQSVEQAVAWLAHMIPGAQWRPADLAPAGRVSHKRTLLLREHACASSVDRQSQSRRYPHSLSLHPPLEQDPHASSVDAFKQITKSQCFRSFSDEVPPNMSKLKNNSVK